MTYCNPNFKTKKALKEAVAQGKIVTVYEPGMFAKDYSQGEFKVCLEGPHYPEPHRWYASCKVKDGKVIKVS